MRISHDHVAKYYIVAALHSIFEAVVLASKLWNTLTV